MEINKKTLRTVILGVMGCILLYWLLHETERIAGGVRWLVQLVQPFLVGGGLAFVLSVPTRFFENLLQKIPGMKGQRLLAILLTFVALALVIALVIGLLVPQLRETLKTFAEQFMLFLERAEAWVREMLNEHPELVQWIYDNTELENYDWAGIAKQAIDLVGESFRKIFSGAISAVGTLVNTVWGVFISLIFGLYCLSSRETLARQGRRLAYAILPEHWADRVIRVLRLANKTFSGFLSGQCLEMVILGCLFAVTMTILGMPYVPLVSVLVAVTAFIPVVGAWIGCVLGAFFILVNDPMQAVWFVVMFLVLQQIENNLIYPRVVGTSIGLPSMWVLVAVTVGGDIMGVAGMLVMIPLASVVYTLLREWTAKRVAQRNIPTEKLQVQPAEVTSKFKEKRAASKRRREAKKAAELAKMVKQSLHIPEKKEEEQEEQ